MNVQKYSAKALHRMTDVWTGVLVPVPHHTETAELILKAVRNQRTKDTSDCCSQRRPHPQRPVWFLSQSST